MDPPYPALNGTAYFAHYTKDRFGSEEQHRLADVVRELDGRDCRIMISNADVPEIRRLYRGFSMRSIDVTRYVSSQKTKHRVAELIITNY